MESYTNNFYYDDRSVLNRKDFKKALAHEEQSVAFGISSKYMTTQIRIALIDNIHKMALKENYYLDRSKHGKDKGKK